MKLKAFLLFLLLTSPAFADMEKARQAAAIEDWKTAFAEYLIDANAGNTEAQTALANIYKSGLGSFPKDEFLAFQWYLSAAEGGNMDAQYEIATSYDYGIAAEADMKLATTWYIKAAEQGHSRAQNNLAGIYGEGRGTPVNIRESLKWLKKSADNNNLEALFSYGLMYHNGLNARKNSKKAANHFEQAFIAGKSDAITYLSEYAYLGTGLKKSKIDAMKWLLLGLDGSNTGSLRKLNPKDRDRLTENKIFLEQQMTEREIEIAKSRATKYAEEKLSDN